MEISHTFMDYAYDLSHIYDCHLITGSPSRDHMLDEVHMKLR